MTRRPFVALDVDGVSANFIQGVLDILLERHQVLVHHDQIRTWSIFDCIPRGLEFEKTVRMEIHRPGFCYGLHVYEGAREGVQALMEIADVAFVTAQYHDDYGVHETWTAERTRWIQDKLGVKDIDKRICFTSMKRRFRADILVDDHPGHVRDWANDHDERGVAVLWDHPTNRGVLDHVLPLNAGRIQGWDELLQLVKSRS